MNFNWMRALSAWQTRFGRRSRRPAKHPPRTYKPQAESLEDRWLPSSWSPLTSGTTNDLWGIWAGSGTNLYTVGNNGTILHSSDGTTWSAQTSGTTNLLYTIWGSSATNLYAVGNSGTILHSSDGTTWSAQTSGTANNLYWVWGTSATNVYAVGTSGTILHSTDGSTWSALTSGTTNDLDEIWGTSATNLYVVGNNGTILHSTDGSTWSAQTSGTTNTLEEIWGSSATNVYAVGLGGTILHSTDGSTWSAQTSGTTNNLIGLWGSSATNLYAVGFSGTILHSTDGSTWTSQASGTTNNLYGVVGTPATAYVVGAGGTMLTSNQDSLVFTSQPVSTTAGTTFSTTVTVEGTDGSTDTNYRGTISFSSSDTNGSVVLPSSYTFLAGDNGVHTFTNAVKLVTVGNQTITATDSSNGITGTSPTVAITPAAASQFALTGLSGAVAGTLQSLTVTAKDQYGNVATGYTGTVSFSSSDSNVAVVLPGSYTFVGGDNGVHTFSSAVKLVTAGNQTVTATDSGNSLSNTSAAVAITPAAASQFALTGLSGAVAGTLQTLTVTAKDQYGNVASGYRGAVSFSSSDTNGSVVLPSSYTFLAGDNGVHTFSNGVKLVTVGNQTVTATDSGNSLSNTSAAVAITPAAASQFALTGLSGAVAGTTQTLTVTAKDQYGNTATGYTGTVSFSSSDTNAGVVLPNNYTFVAGDNGVHTFSNAVVLVTAGNQTVSAIDSGNGFSSTSPAVAITPAAAIQFFLTGLTGAVAGTLQSLTVTAKDTYNNTVTGYRGTVSFSSSDSNASVVLPANYTFTASDNGVHTFSNAVKLVTVGNQFVLAADNGNGFGTFSPAVAITPAAASQLILTGLSGAVAGTTQTLTVTAKDQYGNTATGYRGTVSFSSSDTNASVAVPANYTFVGGDNGVHTFNNGVKLVTAGNQTVSAIDSGNSIGGTSAAVAITPAAASQLVLTGLSGAVAGTLQSLTVTAKDPYGNTATGYTGSVIFDSSDGNAAVVLPGSYTFAAGDNGVHTFNNGVKLVTVGNQTVSAIDSGNSIGGTSAAVAITPAAASQFVLTGLVGAVAGTAQTLTVTAKDQYGNTATGYTGTVSFSSSDSNVAVVLPGSYTFVGGDNGVHTFSSAVKLVTAGNQTVTATDSGNSLSNTSAAVAITPAAASQFALTGLSGAVAGTLQTLTVTAKDQYGNVASGYRGAVSFSSSDTNGSVVLPSSYTFLAGDNGVHTFSNGVKLVTVGNQTVTATDSGNSLSNTSAAVAITPAAASQFALTGLSGAVAGTNQSLTVTAKDQYGNVATGYTGTVHFTSSDSNAAVVLPANYTFSGSDNGVHTFTNAVKLVTAGNQTVTATDSGNSLTGTSPAVAITPAAANQLILSSFGSSVTAGTTHSLTVTAKDAYGNVATGYRGTIRFSSTDPRVAGLPVSYTFTSGDNGIHTFANVIFKTAGNQTITATDSGNSINGTSPAVTVTPAAAATFMVAGYISPATAGAGQNVTVTALDAYGNTATGYRGTVHFTSSDGQAGLPSDYTFVSGDNGIHTFSVTLKTAATQSITATDTMTATITGSETGITVTAAAAVTLVVSGFTSPTTAGITQTVVVTAQDAYGNTATGYTGTVHFGSSDRQAQLPMDYTFTGGDAGTKGFSATLKTAGLQSITATDTATSTITGTQPGIRITPAAAAALSVGGFTSPTTAGTSHNLTVTALDPFGNTATSYTGTVHFTSTDAQATLPADYTFVSGDNGVHTFSVTLKTAGARSLTATDTVNSSFTATQPGISVSPAAASRFTVAGLASATAGTNQTLTVTALDAFSNVAIGYTGTVHFSSSDAQAGLPADYTFIGGDAGVHTFTATLKTAGSQSLTATDTQTGTITGTQTGIRISPAAASSLGLTGLSGTTTAGTGQSITITLRDAFGNVATGYTGTVHFSSSDAQAALPADYTFVGSDAGVHTFSITFKTAGSQSATVADTAATSLHATSNAQTVVPAAAATFHLGAPAGSVVGNFFGVTLTVLDSFGNVVTGYTGTAHWSSSDATALLPADYTFTAGDAGSHTFAAALAFRRLGTPTLMAGDTAISTLNGSAPVVSSNPLEEVFVIGADRQVYGQKLDAVGNPVGGYFPVGPGEVLSVSVGHDASGRPEVFVVGLDHQVYAHQFDAAGNPVGSYFLTQPGQIQSLAVGRDAVGRPELFVIGLDSQVYALKFDANGNPVGSYSLTAVGQVRTLAVGRQAFGQPEVFVIGLDSQVYAQQFDANGNSIDPYVLTQPGQVKSLSVGEDAAFNPEVFVIGLDNQVWAEKIGGNGTAVSPYFLTQAGQVLALEVGQDGNFNPEVFVIGLDNQVYAQQFDAHDNSASGYFLTQPGQVLDMQVGQDAANRPELFVTGLDNQAYGAQFDANGNPLDGYFLMQAGEIAMSSIALA